MAKQLILFKHMSKTFFGGKLLYKKRKSKRPLAYKRALHVVLRSSWAGGPYSFLRPKNRVFIEKLLVQTAVRFRVKLYRKAIAGNHLHLIILCSDKDSYHGFISVVSGRLASHVMNYQSFKNFIKVLNAENTKSTTAGGACTADASGAPTQAAGRESTEVFGTDQKFFNFRPFTRILNWGKDFTASCRYIKRNILEALGFILYKPRKDYYSRWVVKTYPVFSSA